MTKVRRWEDLAATKEKFLQRISEIVECGIGGFSVGPEREQTIICDPKLQDDMLRGQICCGDKGSLSQ